MATRQECRDEAAQEAREHPDCVGCHLGITHDHDDEENDE